MCPVVTRHNRKILLIFSFILFAEFDALASEELAENQLIIAEDAFLDVEYEGALEALERAESTDGVTDSQLARIFALRGTIYYLLDNEREATTAYRRLLTMEPSFELSDTHPPRAVEFLESLRGDYAPSTVEVDHRQPRHFVVGDPLVLEASISGVRPSHTVRIFYRPEGERSYSSTPMEQIDGTRFEGEIPASGRLASTEGGIVEYFILVAEGEERLANAGSPHSPLSFEIIGDGETRSPNSNSIVRRWWFWTIIGGAVAVGLGVGLGLGLGGSDDVDTGSVEGTLTFSAD